MEHAKRLYLIDKFDREYKRVQRPSAVVAKAQSAVQLDDTLDDDDEDDGDAEDEDVDEVFCTLLLPPTPPSAARPATTPPPQR